MNLENILLSGGYLELGRWSLYGISYMWILIEFFYVYMFMGEYLWVIKLGIGIWEER